MIARVSTPSQGAVSFSRVLASQSSQLGLPTSRLRIAHKPTCRLKAGTILLNEVGWKPRKTPAAGEVFFPDSCYRTYRELDSY